MATSADEISASLRRSRQRLALARRRRRRHLLGCLALILPVAGFFFALHFRRQAPAPPNLLVKWPKPQRTQELPGGSLVLARPGSPFTITITEANHWQVTWANADLHSRGPEVQWQPSGDEAELRAYCRAIAVGWRRYFSWLWPLRRVDLYAVWPSKSGGPLWEVKAARSVWLTWRVRAAASRSAPVAWDERALPRLLQVTPPRLLSAPAASPLWEIVPSFGPPRAAQDIGTYARPPDLDTAGFVRVTRQLARAHPRASFKLVLVSTPGTKPGLLRVAFDNQAGRAGWIAGPSRGDTGAVLEWWEPQHTFPPLAPSLPPRPS